MPESYHDSSIVVFGDFNNDNRHDIAYVPKEYGADLNDTHRLVI